MKKLPLGAYYAHYTYLHGQRLPDIARAISRYSSGNIQILPQILSRQYLAILASQGNMYNKHRVAPLNSHAKMVYMVITRKVVWHTNPCHYGTLWDMFFASMSVKIELNRSTKP